MEENKRLNREQIRNIIAEKAWYGLDPENGAFNWRLSLEKLGESLMVNPDYLSQLITNCFTPDCLIKAKLRTGEGEIEKPLVDALIDLGISPHIWTVGDPQWQRTKFERVGLESKIADDNYHCASQKKEEDLRRVIENLSKKGKRYFLVVDDKGENIEKIKRLAEELREKGLMILDYHFKKSDPQADGTAFLNWLMEQLRQHPELEVFLDFDGVVADTDGVLFGPVVEAIFEMIEN